MTNITAFTPGGKTAKATHGNTKEGRRGMEYILDMQYQTGYLAGYATRKEQQDRQERIEPIGDAIIWGCIGLLAGLAIALYVIAPAF